MYAMTLKEQAEVCRRLRLTCSYCADMSRAIQAAAKGEACPNDAKLIREQLQRFADHGRGNEKSEAIRALAPLAGVTNAKITGAQANVISCADAWMTSQSLPTYTELRDSLAYMLNEAGHLEQEHDDYNFSNERALLAKAHGQS